MKFDNAKHKHTWRVQKGCTVEWVDGSKKYRGVVKQVVSVPGLYGKEPSQVVVETNEDLTFTVDVVKIRIVKTANTIRNDQYRS